MSMKRIFFIIVSVIISNNVLISQDNPESEYWYQMIPGQEANLQRILSAANSAINTKNNTDTSEGSGHMVAFRFQKFWQYRTGPGTAGTSSCFSAADQAMDDFYHSKDRYLKTAPAFDHEWKYIGRDSAETHCMGIVVSLAIDTSDAELKTIYAGTNASGLWKTIDGGENWFNVTDVIGLPGMGVNDVVMDPYDTDILYICTGVTTFQRGYGVGIWKSTDAGNSWMKIWGNGNTAQLVQKLLIDPANSNKLFAFINDKVYRSENAGQDWQIVFDEIYQPYSWKTRCIRDAAFKPGSGDTLYIISEGTQQFLSDTVLDFHPEIWQCFNASQENLIWARIDDTLNWQYSKRASIAVCKAEPDFLYCSFSYNDENNFCLFRYDAADGAWHKKTDTITENFLQAIDEWRNDLLVSPGDTNVFYVGGFYVSKIVGNTITQSGAFHSDAFHVDVRDMMIIEGSSPDSGAYEDILFVANDGGISKTIDGAATWESINGRGLRITQYYDLAVSKTQAGLYAGGTQDNGLIIHNPDWGNPWNIHVIGDNYSTIIDHSNSNFIYSLLFTDIPGILVSTDGGLTVNEVEGFPSNENVTHGWPLVLAPQESGTLYTGLRDGYKSTDYANTWAKFSEFTIPPHLLDSSQKVEDLQVYKLDNRIIYIAYAGPFLSTPGKKLFKTLDGGLNWMDISVHLDFLEYRGITSIEIHPTDHNKAWLSLGGFGSLGTLKVIYTDDSFSTYQDISEGLPNLPVNCIKVNNTLLNEVFLCNDAAVYYRNDTMLLWEKYGVGLPVCIVSDLEIDQAINKVKISTFGRGLWEIDGMDPNFSIPEDEVMNNINIFPNPATDQINIRYSTLRQAKDKLSDTRSFDKLRTSYSMFIYDIFGRQQLIIEIPAGQDQLSIDVSDYLPGIYVIVLKNKKRFLGQRKFVVK